MTSLPTLPYVDLLDGSHGNVMVALNKIARFANGLSLNGMQISLPAPIPLLPSTTILTDVGSITDVLNRLVNQVNTILIGGSAGGSTQPLPIPPLTVAPEDGRSVVAAYNAVVVWLNQNFSAFIFSDQLSGVSGNFQNIGCREVIHPGGLSVANAGTSRAVVTMQVAALTAGSVAFLRAYLGEGAAAGNEYNFDGNQVQLLVSGAGGFSFSGGGGQQTLTFDPVIFTYNQTKKLGSGLIIATR